MESLLVRSNGNQEYNNALGMGVLEGQYYGTVDGSWLLGSKKATQGGGQTILVD
jgi:hypothetical protein